MEGATQPLNQPAAGKGLVWFRRDLRLEDHAALSQALKNCERVWCVFVFDTDILAPLAPDNRRVVFIWHTLQELAKRLRQAGGGLLVRHGGATAEIPGLAVALGATAVYANHDYEPAARARDDAVRRALAAQDIAFHTFKDQVIFEGREVLTGTRTAFTVFTPYKRAWLKRLEERPIEPWPVQPWLSRLAPVAQQPWPTLPELGFADTLSTVLTGMSGGEQLFDDFLRRIDAYEERRNYPAQKGPSYLSVHLRFGTLSIRRLVAAARARPSAGAQTWLSELIWREFYFAILSHFPHVVSHAFRAQYEQLAFENDPHKFAAWCEGRTGYPLVDAGMRQLNQTGYMHNRLRMVTASFLVKDLHVDWRWGERYFAEKLLDHDLAANNGGWQWAASTGCDAQPWFRIFNPVLQSEKFDAEGEFIRRHIPELTPLPAKAIHAPWRLSAMEQAGFGVRIGHDYPAPIIDHDEARKLTLERYRAAASG